MRHCIRKSFFLLLPAFAAALAAAQSSSTGVIPPRNPPPPDTSVARQQAEQGREASALALRITYGRKSAEWTVEKLAALPHETLRATNQLTQAEETFRGVPLMALLVEVGVPQRPKGKDFRLYVLVEGRDGYKVVYSLGEVSPDVHDGSVLLADSIDGKPLGDSGPIELVCSGERRPARWVHGVASVRVFTAD